MESAGTASFAVILILLFFGFETKPQLFGTSGSERSQARISTFEQYARVVEKDSEGGDKHFGVIVYPPPRFPQYLLRRGVSKGFALILLCVSAEGRLDDWLVLETGDRLFIKEIDKVIEDWWFDMPLVDGEPQAMVAKLLVTFNMDSTKAEVAADKESLDTRRDKQLREWNSIRPRFSPLSPYRVASISELDKAPVPRYLEEVKISPSMLDECLGAEAVFEFYIDENGDVRIPSLIELTKPVTNEILVTAQNALKRWKFDSPTVRKKRVVVKVAQRFSFGGHSNF